MRGDEPVPLTPKAFAVLDCLAARRGWLVTKDELLAAVWGGAFVGEGVLKGVIAEIRRAIGESARAPRFIETLHRRGYRLLAAAGVSGGEVRPARSLRVPSGLVGRAAEMTAFEGWAAEAAAGRRRVVFVPAHDPRRRPAGDERSRGAGSQARVRPGARPLCALP